MVAVRRRHLRLRRRPLRRVDGRTTPQRPGRSRSSPTPTAPGYWLVASDGGIFAFDAAFRGSMGGRRLNRPVTGMVPFGNGYLMVGEDGGVFNFSDRPFAGSLGADPPARPSWPSAPCADPG